RSPSERKAGPRCGAGLAAYSKGLTGEIEDLVEDAEALVELLARDRQRRRDDDHVPVRHQVEAALQRRLRQLRDRCERLAARVEGNERLASLAIADELDAPEEPLPAHLADRRVALLKPWQLLGEHLAHRGRVLDDALFL